MPLVYANLVKETTTATGTGALTLLGAVSGFFPFSTIGNLNTCKYEVEDATGNKEVGQGTYTLSSNTLSRDSVETSTNGNSLVNFGPGTKTVHLDVPASFFTAIPNSNLANSSLTVTAGSGLSGGGAASLGGAVALTANVTSVAGRMGAVTIANTDVSGLGGLATLNAAPAGTLTGTTLNSTVVASSLTSVGTLSAGSIPYSLVTGGPSAVSGANPTATIGVVAVNGSAGTFLRSDGAPTINQAAAWAFSALGNTNLSSGNVLSWNSDAGISRTAAATLAVGNGTQGDASGTIVAAKFSIAGGSSSMFNGSGYLTFQSPSNGFAWTSSAGTNPQVNGLFASDNSANVRLISTGTFGWNTSTGNPTSSGTNQAFWSSPTTASIQQGGPDATAPVAQTYRFQSVANTATANTAAPNATIILPLGLGNANTGGGLIIQAGAQGTSGTTQQTAATIFTLAVNGLLTCPAFFGTSFVQSVLLYAGGSGTAAIGSPSNGVLTLWNQTINGFGRLQFGGTTASFSSIKANGTALNFRLADDSGDCAITAGAATFSGAITQTAKTTTYNNIATAGNGLASVLGIDNRTGVTSADGAATTLYTAPAANGVYRISADIFATAAVTGTANYTITWTENGTTQTSTVSATAINVLGTATNMIRPDNGTIIKAQLLGTFTGTFSVIGSVEQIG